MKTLESIRFTDRDGNSWEYGEEHTLRIYQPDGLFLPLPDGSVFLDAYENREAGIPFWAVVRGFGETAAKAGISGLGVAEARQFSAETKTDLHTVPKAYVHWKTEGTTQIVQYGHSSSVYRPESFTFKALCGKDAITIAEKHSPAVDADGKDRIWEPCPDATKAAGEYKTALEYFRKLVIYSNNMFFLARDLFTATFMLACDIHKETHANCTFADSAKTLIQAYLNLLSIRVANVLTDKYETSLTLPNSRSHVEALLPAASGRYAEQIQGAIDLLPTEETAVDFFQSQVTSVWKNIDGKSGYAAGKPATQHTRHKFAAHTEEGLLRDENPASFGTERYNYSRIQDVLVEMRIVIDVLQYTQAAVFGDEGGSLPEDTGPDGLFNADMALAFSEIPGTGLPSP